MILDHVTACPGQFDPGTWGRRGPDGGIVADLGGRAMLLSGYQLEGGRYRRPDGTRVGRMSAEARRLLDLSDGEYYGPPGPLFAIQERDLAVLRLRALVEAADRENGG